MSLYEAVVINCASVCERVCEGVCECQGLVCDEFDGARGAIEDPERQQVLGLGDDRAHRNTEQPRRRDGDMRLAVYYFCNVSPC